MAVTAEQRRRLEELARQQKAAQQKAASKPQNNTPVGSKRADGKQYAGADYGYQSPASFQQLQREGRFKLGSGFADKIERAVAPAVQGVQNFQARFRKATDNIPGIQAAERAVNKASEASTKTVAGRGAQGASAIAEGAANKLNIDPRIAATGLLVGQVAIGGRGRATAPTSPATAVGRRLGGADKRLAFQRTFHGTSESAAQKIRAGGHVASPGGVYGQAVYTGNRKMAQQYAESAGRRLGENGRVLQYRVPKANQQTIKFEPPQNRIRIQSPQAGVVQGNIRQGKSTRVDYGNGSHVTPLSKAQADKTLVPANGQLRVSKAQAEAVKTRPQRISYGNVSASEGKYFKPGKRQVDTEKIAQNIERQLKSSKGGFTVDPRTGKTPTRGSQVAIDGRVLRDTSPEGIRRFVERNKAVLSRPDTKVGGWTSERSGKPVIELSRRVRSQAEATRLGKKFQQEGVWDNKAGKYVATGGNDQLRHTKGAQTKGGARIGGEQVRTPIKGAQPANTVKKPGPKPEPAAAKKRNVNLLGIQRGPKKFTPGERAKAVQRGNNRKIDNGRIEFRNNETIGVGSSRGHVRDSDGTTTHHIAFGHSKAKSEVRGINDTYGSRRDIGEAPKSKGKERLRTAGLKDLMARNLNVDQFDTVKATPTTPSRGILYNRASKGALGVRRGNKEVESVRVGPNMWINKADGGKRVKFDPKTLSEPLDKLTKTKATRVGRAAGGTSKKAALIDRPANTVRNPKAQQTKVKAGAKGRQTKAAREAEAARKVYEDKIRNQAMNSGRRPTFNYSVRTDGLPVHQRQGVVRNPRGSRVSQLRRSEAQISRQAQQARQDTNAVSRFRQGELATRRADRTAATTSRSNVTRQGRLTGGAKETLRIKRVKTTTPSRGTDIRSREGVVRSPSPSRVPRERRIQTRVQNQYDGPPPRRTASESRAVDRFIRQDADTRDRGGRRTWNGTYETRRIRRTRR